MVRPSGAVAACRCWRTTPPRPRAATVHRIAVSQLRVHPPAQAYLARLQAAGKPKREALRALKRRLVRVVINLLHANLEQAELDQSAAPCRLTNQPLDMEAMQDGTRLAHSLQALPQDAEPLPMGRLGVDVGRRVARPR